MRTMRVYAICLVSTLHQLRTPLAISTPPKLRQRKLFLVHMVLFIQRSLAMSFREYTTYFRLILLGGTKVYTFGRTLGDSH